MGGLDFVIIGGIVVIVVDSYVVDIGIKNGCIVQIGIGFVVFECIDVIGFLVLLGGIDVYVYLDQLILDGMMMVDDFVSGMCLVVVGGNMMVLFFVLQIKGQLLCVCVEDYCCKV